MLRRPPRAAHDLLCVVVSGRRGTGSGNEAL